MNKKIKIIVLIVALILLIAAAGFLFISGRSDDTGTGLSGQGATEAGGTTAATDASTEAPTDAPTEEPTEAPTEEPTEPPVLYRNPLTGEPVAEPVTQRIFAVTINNVPDAIPHIGVNDCDILFEMFINGYATRGLALYTDLSDVEQIGSVRSLRYNFTDLAVAYDMFVAHAGGSDEVIRDASKNRIDHKNIDCTKSTSYSFRDMDRNRQGWGFVHCLFAEGPGLLEWAANQGYKVTQEPDKTYGLNFTENGAPADGEAATTVYIDMIHQGNGKNTTMIYNEELGQYVYNQYGKEMRDGHTNEPESFENVFVIMTKVTNSGVYHVANLQGSGEGYYACDGKIIPILWSHEVETDPITFTLTDGTPLEQGIGRSYIAIAPLESKISWE